MEIISTTGATPVPPSLFGIPSPSSFVSLALTLSERLPNELQSVSISVIASNGSSKPDSDTLTFSFNGLQKHSFSYIDGVGRMSALVGGRKDDAVFPLPRHAMPSHAPRELYPPAQPHSLAIPQSCGLAMHILSKLEIFCDKTRCPLREMPAPNNVDDQVQNHRIPRASTTRPCRVVDGRSFIVVRWQTTVTGGLDAHFRRHGSRNLRLSGSKQLLTFWGLDLFRGLC